MLTFKSAIERSQAARELLVFRSVPFQEDEYHHDPCSENKAVSSPTSAVITLLKVCIE